MGRKIVITSGKGGVGKTTVTSCLAYKLAVRGERVVAVDGDLGLNNLDVAMGVENKISYDLFDCLEDRCRVRQATVQSPWHKNLFVLPARFGKNRYHTNLEKMRSVISELARGFDFVLLDCPAGIDEGFRRAVACSEEALVVISPHVSSIRDADKVINLLGEYRDYNVSVIINKMRGDLAAEGDILTPREIEALLKVKIKGVIPEDDKILYGLTPNDGKSSRAFSVLADNVLGDRFKQYDCMGKYVGFFGSIRRKLKKLL